MTRFSIDAPRLHAYLGGMLLAGEYPDWNRTDLYLGTQVAEFLNCLVQEIFGPDDRVWAVTGVDSAEDVDQLIVTMRDADINEGDPVAHWTDGLFYDIDDWIDWDSAITQGPGLTVASLEQLVGYFVDVLNDLDKWRLIKR